MIPLPSKDDMYFISSCALIQKLMSDQETIKTNNYGKTNDD